MKRELLRFTAKGIYCERADIFIDPWRSVEKALITHGHADHARNGHGSYLAHDHTVSIMQHRLGSKNTYQAVQYHEPIMINGVSFTFIPAGHILGSSQIKVEYRGRIEVVTGDYKIENDGISGSYEPIPCHKIVTECTFGLPIFQWYEQAKVKEEINQWIRLNTDNKTSSVLHGYSLGKAQRLLHLIETDLPIYLHGAVHHMTQIYREAGIPLPPTIYPLGKEKPTLPCVVISPPSADSTWLKKFKPYRTAFASGWMALRGPRRMRSMDKGFVLSDHLDWKGLQTVMRECNPEKVVCTHGYTQAYAQYLNESGIHAVTEKTEFETENVE